MGGILESWRVTRARRQEGPEPVRGDIPSTAATGEEWVRRVICEPFGIHMDDLMRIFEDINESSAPNLTALSHKLPLDLVIHAAVAAGFTNGVALGLIHGSQARVR